MKPNGKCRTCRYWDMHSLDYKLGDCRAPHHNPLHARISVLTGIAFLDGGTVETLPTHTCEHYSSGQQEIPIGHTLKHLGGRNWMVVKDDVT